MEEKKCEVCSVSKSLYKCPKCRIRYCSKDCFIKHKSEDCEAKNPMPTTTSSIKVNNPEIEELDSQILSDRQKEKLKNDPKLKQLLRSKRFCDDLDTIDLATDRREMLKRKRTTNPEIDAIMLHILKIIQEEGH
jgi:zinc finger HIT domain-containing protein 3